MQLGGSFYGAPPAPYNPPPPAAIPGVGPFGPFVGPPLTPQQMYPFKPPSFDPYLCENFFPRSSTEAEETAQTQFLLAKHNDILPSSVEQSAISALIGKVKQSLDKIIVAPESFSQVGIEEVREVGSFKKGTMLAKHNVADLVVVLKTLPVIEAVNSLGQQIVQDLKAEHHSEVFGCVTRDFGCEIAGTHAVVRVLITILPQNASQLDKDLHLPERELLRNMAALRHARWFEENASHSVVKALIRILKYLRLKHEGLKSLNVWCLELLAHYCVMNTPMRTPLPLALAFRRFFQVLAAGILLPNSPALVDPCDAPARIHFSLSLDEMDSICSTAQTLLRIILHGGTEQLFAGEGISAVSTEMSIWENVVITPLEKAYSETDMQPYYGDEKIVAGGDNAVISSQPQLASTILSGLSATSFVCQIRIPRSSTSPAVPDFPAQCAVLADQKVHHRLVPPPSATPRHKSVQLCHHPIVSSGLAKCLQHNVQGQTPAGQAAERVVRGPERQTPNATTAERSRASGAEGFGIAAEAERRRG